MKTNLIFKRQTTSEGVVKTVTRIVSVDVPYINSGEGWILSGHTDALETCEDVYVHHLAPESEIIPIQTGDPLRTEDPLPITTAQTNTSSKFESPVKGTARLIRTKGTVRITYRKNNVTAPNSVCITDVTKQEFFNHCRRRYGRSTSVYQFDVEYDKEQYNFWSSFMDEEYNRQKLVFLENN